MLTSLTYISRPKIDAGSTDIQDVWMHALEKNERLEISGALYFDGTSVVQYLEGEEAPLHDLFGQIKADPRHEDVEILGEADLASRLFSTWPLKLIDGSRSTHLQGIFDYDTLIEASRNQINKLAFRLRRL